MMSVVSHTPVLSAFSAENPLLTGGRILGRKEHVIKNACSIGQIHFSPPLSRSPTPDVPQPAAEVEPRTIGKKTAEFFGFPSYPSSSQHSHNSSQETMEVHTEFDTGSWNPLDRPPSPVRPHSLTYSFFFEQHRPSVLKFPLKHPLKLPPIEHFFPSRLCRPPGMKVNDWDDEYGRPILPPELSPVGVIPELQKVAQDQHLLVPMTAPPPLKIDSEFVTQSPRSFQDLVLEELPSMFSSPVPSSPVYDSPTPITPSPLGSPKLSNTEKSLDESIESFSLQESGPVPLAEGVIVGSEPPLRLIRILGLGAFSSVWLARDILHRLESVGGRPNIPFKRDDVGALKKGDRTGHGLRPPLPTASKVNQIGRSTSVYFKARNADSSGRLYMTKDDKDHGRLVALKMMERVLCDNDDRTRISFMREVEILRHISHPSIVSYLHSFSTSTHHCIVLEALLGGELLELICQGDNFTRMSEPLIRRIFGELCHAVSWMHGVGLVHRDVKLENVLCTMNPFLPNAVLPPPSTPLIKLTDFGLARFIDPVDPLLTTRCGSDSYAAPEIILCKPYDGRQTDAWACGVVLFALATSLLPFDKPIGADTRRALLSRIARVDYSWPEDAPLATEGLKSVAHSFLVRNPAERSSVPDIWDNSWMHGEGAPPPPAPGGTLVSSEISHVARQETV